MAPLIAPVSHRGFIAPPAISISGAVTVAAPVIAAAVVSVVVSVIISVVASVGVACAVIAATWRLLGRKQVDAGPKVSGSGSASDTHLVSATRPTPGTTVTTAVSGIAVFASAGW